VQSEAQLLRSNGVEVREAVFDNESTTGDGVSGVVRIVLNCAWSWPAYARVIELCGLFRPDVVHVHNFWIRLSPSVHAASRKAGVPTVQTLHNFRLLCSNALLYRNGGPCEECIGKTQWRGVAHRCYRDSALASAAVATMNLVNRSRGTWEQEVDALIALSEHSMRKFAAGGLPGDRIFVKPNSIEDPGSPMAPSLSKTLLYAGRLSPEKGVNELLSAWAEGDIGRYGRLILAGDGPERAALERIAASLGVSSSVEFAGHRRQAEIPELIRSARAVVVPSLCYENFPRIVVEAFAHGKPAIVSDLGALREIVHDGAGMRFHAGDHAALARALNRMLNDDRLADRLGDAARAEYLRKYTPERNFEQLMAIYRFACNRRLQLAENHTEGHVRPADSRLRYG
jgi:glycosyltransferase involved in cell wall biosynthesis